MSERPNIVLCTCDQLRPFAMGCYGNDFVRTPNLDRLAAGGVRFATAVTNFPVCMAARSVLLSGQYNRTCTGGVANVCYPQGDGVVFFPQYPVAGRPHLPAPTLPEVLRDHGYETAAIGKWHIHSWPDDVGFDSWVIPRVNHCHLGQSFTENGGVEFVPEGWSVDFEAARLRRFLGARTAPERPFFMYYNISPPHCPLADAPEEYLTMYRPEDVPLRPNVNPEIPIADQDHWFSVYRWDFRYYNHRLPAACRLPDGYSLRHVIAEYYGLVTWVDDTVGRMLDVLAATGLAANTIVVFTSDHGDNLGSHGLVQKGQATEESARIPLLVRGPGLAPAVPDTHVASLVDLAPTLLSLAGIDVPGHFHGRDLAALCRGGGSPAPTHAIVETVGGPAVRTPRHLYGLPYADGDRRLGAEPSHFYDVAADPYQLRDLAGTGEQAEVAATLDAALRGWDAATPWLGA